MRKFKAVGLIFLLFACIAAALVYSISLLGQKIGNTFSTISNSLPGDTSPVPGMVESLPPFFSSPSGGGAGPLDEVDSLLQSSMRGSLAYNAPPEMDLQETVKLHLVLSPNQSEEELKKQVTEPGSVFSSDNIKLTDKMEAKLRLLVEFSKRAATIGTPGGAELSPTQLAEQLKSIRKGTTK